MEHIGLTSIRVRVRVRVRNAVGVWEGLGFRIEVLPRENNHSIEG